MPVNHQMLLHLPVAWQADKVVDSHLSLHSPYKARKEGRAAQVVAPQQVCSAPPALAAWAMRHSALPKRVDPPLRLSLAVGEPGWPCCLAPFCQAGVWGVGADAFHSMASPSTATAPCRHQPDHASPMCYL